MFSGISEFFNKYKYSAADSRSFFGVFRDLTGRNLRPFFNNWFNSHLLPEVLVSHFIQTGSDGDSLIFDLTQTRSLFMFPLWLEWQENRKKIRKKVIVDEKVSSFSFKLTGKPTRIKINPNRAVPGTFIVK